jgi:hypothetical protein
METAGKTSNSNKVFLGLALIGIAYLIWDSATKKEAAAPTTTEPTPTPLPKEDPVVVAPVMTQAEANALVSKLILGKLAGTPVNRAKNEDTVKLLMAGGYEPQCTTSGNDGYSCIAVKSV